jgi:ABC-type antimicrobial peptide transport system permease subunit
VQQRVREFGVRMALGATSRDVMTLVLGSGARLVVIGVSAGLAAAAIATRSLSNFLFGVQPLDVVSFVSAALLLVVTAAIAMAIPAWRAARVDPIDALRNS